MQKLLYLTAVVFLAADARASLLFTNSSDFYAALGTAPARLEDFSSAHSGDLVNTGQRINDVTFQSFNLGGGAAMLDITDLYASVSANSLGADHRANARDNDGSSAVYFYGGEGFHVSLAAPVFAAGVFFNVNQDSGWFGITTSDGITIGNDSSSLEARGRSDTLVFAGLISDHAFSGFNVWSRGTYADYNVAAIAYASPLATGTSGASIDGPEPSTGLLAAGLALILFLNRRRLASRLARR